MIIKNDFPNPHKNIHCDPSSELPHLDSSDKRSQHVFSRGFFLTVIIKYSFHLEQ